jgi:hypothetical protein
MGDQDSDFTCIDDKYEFSGAKTRKPRKGNGDRGGTWF